MTATGHVTKRVANKLIISGIFALIHHLLTAAVELVVPIPVSGTLDDLMYGITHISSDTGIVALAWWVSSSVVLAFVLVELIRHQNRIIPYREEGSYSPPRLTASNLAFLGVTISVMFFLMEMVTGMLSQQNVVNVHTYQDAMSGNVVPLLVSAFLSVATSLLSIEVVTRSAKAKDTGLSSLKSRLSEANTAADTRGLSPGTLIHVGKKRMDKTVLSSMWYDEGQFSETETAHDVAEHMAQKGRGIRWININGVHDPGTIKKLGDEIGLHKLHQADIMNTDLRPVLHADEDKIFIILKMPRFEDDGQLLVEHISIIVGPSYVISFQEAEGDVFDPVRRAIRQNAGNIRKKGSDYLAYSLMDAIFDSFFVIMENVSDRTEDLEKQIMNDRGIVTLHEIYDIKREMALLRKIMWPMREVAMQLERSDSPLIREDTRNYIRDVYNHAVQTIDTVESLRDTVGSVLDTYMSISNNRMNEIMKTLTVIASIFIPITFITGVYGTNFAYIPELGWDGGYFAMLLSSAAVAVSMLVWFKKKGWM